MSLSWRGKDEVIRTSLTAPFEVPEYSSSSSSSSSSSNNNNNNNNKIIIH